MELSFQCYNTPTSVKQHANCYSCSFVLIILIVHLKIPIYLSDLLLMVMLYHYMCSYSLYLS